MIIKRPMRRRSKTAVAVAIIAVAASSIYAVSTRAISYTRRINTAPVYNTSDLISWDYYSDLYKEPIELFRMECAEQYGIDPYSMEIYLDFRKYNNSTYLVCDSLYKGDVYLSSIEFLINK